MTGQRLAAVVVVAGLVLTGCTPPALTHPADVTCQLQTEFRGYQRDPGPHRQYLAVCGGKSYELEELGATNCTQSHVDTWVRLTPSKGGAWTCEAIR